MDRRRFLLTLLAGVLAAPFAADAQPAGKVPRIGVVAPAGLHDPDVEGFRQGLRELGYVEGQNLLVEYRAAEGKPERFPDLFGEILRLKVDIIVTGTVSAAVAVKKATSATPVVLAASGDPVGAGVVASLAHPGANITGLSLAPEDTFAEKWVELLKEIVPGLSRVTVLAMASSPGSEIELKAARNAGRALSVKIHSLRWHSPSQLEGLFAVMIAEHANALIVTDDPLGFTYRAKIVDLANRHRLPAIYGLKAFAEGGGLIAYGASLTDLWRRAATYVDKILKGAKPADLPVEQPTKYELVINLKTANTLGLTIPPSLLLRADQVIE
jgi:putative tryptophan/tyrosine transport system substrate-binding protein